MSSKSIQPTYKRQRFLLSFIQSLPNGVSATELQKLVFLYIMNTHSDYYEFVPYKFGSYSFQLAEDIEILRRDSFIHSDPKYIQATEKLKQEMLGPIAQERGNQLIRRVYRAYPYYAINSEIVDRLFEREEAEYFHNQRNLYRKNEQVLFNIGYESKGVENFINTLILNDVRMLIDVRKNPISRKFGFSKGKLEHIMKTIGIKYVHIPELGIESEKRIGLETEEDYYNLFIEYEKTLVKRKRYLDDLYSLFEANVRVALMCFEKNPQQCHRHIIRDYFIENYEIRSIDL